MSAADELYGLSLKNGWKVVAQISRKRNATGGTFSQSYLVEKNGKRGFLTGC